MKTIQISDEDYEKVQEILKNAKSEPEKPKGVKIYKNDGSVLYESECQTIKEAVVEAVSRGLSLSGSNLSGSNLSGSNLSGSNLSGSNLSGSNLSGSNLSRSNLYGSDMRGANLIGSDLYGSNLRGAELCSAKFYGKGGKIELKKEQVKDFLAALGFVVEE